MNTSTKTLSGQCLCGAVRYEVSGPLAASHACYCAQCHRQSGHHTATTHAKRQDFSLTVDHGLK